MGMPSLKRVKLHFAGLKVESTDRDRAIQQATEWGEKETPFLIAMATP